jgi:hypothetical protein
VVYNVSWASVQTSANEPSSRTKREETPQPKGEDPALDIDLLVEQAKRISHEAATDGHVLAALVEARELARVFAGEKSAFYKTLLEIDHTATDTYLGSFLSQTCSRSRDGNCSRASARTLTDRGGKISASSPSLSSHMSSYSTGLKTRSAPMLASVACSILLSDL